MALSDFHASNLFKRIPWRTDAPSSLDPTRLPQEALTFRNAIIEADVSGHFDDLKNTCRQFEQPGDHAEQTIMEFLKESCSNIEQERICASMIQHQIIDLLSWKEEGPKNIRTTYEDIERLPLPKMSHLPHGGIKNWFKTITSAKLSLEAQTKSGFDLSNDVGASGTLLHLTRIAKTGRKVHMLKMISNIETASMHLRHLLDGNLELPDSPETFTKILAAYVPPYNSLNSNLMWSSQNPNVPPGAIKELVKSFNMERLRLPLQLAITLSPLCLLTDSHLNQRCASREKLCEIWWALGGTTPSLLSEVEYHILGIVWDNATRTIDLPLRLQETLSHIITIVQGHHSVKDTAFSWFDNTQRYKLVEPKLPPVTKIANQPTAAHRAEEREEEEEEEEEEEKDHSIEKGKGKAYENKDASDDEMGDDEEEELVQPNERGSSHSSRGQEGCDDGRRGTDERGKEPEINIRRKPQEDTNEGSASSCKELYMDQSQQESSSTKDAAGGDDMQIDQEQPVHRNARSPDNNEDMQVDPAQEGNGTPGPTANADFDEDVQMGSEPSEDRIVDQNNPKSSANPDRESPIPGPSNTLNSTGARKSSRNRHLSVSKEISSPTKLLSVKRKKGVNVKQQTSTSTKKNSNLLNTLPRHYDIIDLTEERDGVDASRIDSTIAEKDHLAKPHWLYPIDGAPPEEHTAAFHHEEDANWFDAMMEATEKFYIDGKPRYLSSPKTSIIRIMKIEEFESMSDRQVQEALRDQHLVITGMKKPKYGFDLEGLETLDQLDHDILIHGKLKPPHILSKLTWPPHPPDMSVPVTDDYNVRHRTGTLFDMLVAAESPNGKTLNSLDFPMQCAQSPPDSLASDIKAWSRTSRLVNRSTLYPTQSTRWGLAVTSGAYHKWHIDTDGLGTYIDPKTGKKVWFIARPKSGKRFASFASRKLFLESFTPEGPNEEIWDIEVVLLTPGTRLIMRPNTPHAVYTPNPAICHGGHFLPSSAIPDICYGAYHSFVSNSTVTNTEHVFDARLLFRRMTLLFSSTITEDCKDEKQPTPGSHRDHIPDITTFDGILDILSIYNFMELANVTNAKLYGDSIFNGERRESITARALCRNLVEIIFSRYELIDKNNKPVCPKKNLILPYLAQQAKCLLLYKKDAMQQGSYADDPNCTYPAVAMALRRYCVNNKDFLSFFKNCKDFDSFAWAGQSWTIRRKDVRSKASTHNGYTYNDRVWLREIKDGAIKLPNLGVLEEEKPTTEKNDGSDDESDDESTNQPCKLVNTITLTT